MKALKIIILGFSLPLVLYLIWLFFFVNNFSSTYPPIETYALDLDNDSFELALARLNKNESYTVKFTDTTGMNTSNPTSYYFKLINHKNQYQYSLKYRIENLSKNQTQLFLLGFHNTYTNQVIYQPDDKSHEVKMMFESEFNWLVKGAVDDNPGQGF